MTPLYSRSLWYAEGLRWIGSLLLSAAGRREHRARKHDTLDPGPR